MRSPRKPNANGVGYSFKKGDYSSKHLKLLRKNQRNMHPALMNIGGKGFRNQT